jgi:hypothetical protein
MMMVKTIRLSTNQVKRKGKKRRERLYIGFDYSSSSVIIVRG